MMTETLKRNETNEYLLCVSVKALILLLLLYTETMKR